MVALPTWVGDVTAEAVEGLQKEEFRLVPIKAPTGEPGTVHLSVSDASGDSAIFEYIDGKLTIHHGKQYQVIGQLGRGDRNKPSDLKRVSVRARDGSMVSLDNLITYDETISPASIYRFNRNVSATISAQPSRPR